MKNYSFAAYILIGLGVYYLFNEFNIPLLKNVDSSTALLFIIGLSLLINSYRTKQSDLLISGATIFGIAIHFYGLTAINTWNNHWSIYILIVGIALLLNFIQTKRGLLVSVIVISTSLLFLFSTKINDLFKSFFNLFGMATTYWPLIFIALGIFLIKTKK